MKNFVIYLAAGASALLMTAASAAPLSPNPSVAPESDIQNVRMVCNESGRCWRERGERRVIIHEHRGSYGYAPRRERYIERRGYEEGGGIGIHWEEIDEDISVASLLQPEKFMRLANAALQPASRARQRRSKSRRRVRAARG